VLKSPVEMSVDCDKVETDDYTVKSDNNSAVINVTLLLNS